MKKTLLTISILTYLSCYAQDNTISTSGNIGIGTLTPSAKLDVNGNASIDSTLTVSDSVLFKSDLRVENDLNVEGEITMFENSEAREDFTVFGNLILPNIQAPSNFLNKDIIIADEIGTLFKSDVPSFRDLLFHEIQCEQSYLDNPFWMSGINKLFTPCPEIKVGIGTNVPQFQLDTRGFGHFSDGVKIGHVDVNGQVFSPTIPAYFEAKAGLNNVRPWMRMTGVDNLGNDHTVFLVNKEGNLFCTAVRVRIKEDIPVPDYVFKSDYKLMPLSEVKSFVQKNSHLPNIPSEAEIKEDGLSLEEMQLKLLEKVEELTLYVIQLEETNQQQQAEINALKATANANY